MRLFALVLVGLCGCAPVSDLGTPCVPTSNVPSSPLSPMKGPSPILASEVGPNIDVIFGFGPDCRDVCVWQRAVDRPPDGGPGSSFVGRCAALCDSNDACQSGTSNRRVNWRDTSVCVCIN
ncbi:MAG: hypothetical protein Q8S33_00145 [Myxococcales bacterium]|nr:hypothetical protein [Myxococcales bacterium]